MNVLYAGYFDGANVLAVLSAGDVNLTSLNFRDTLHHAGSLLVVATSRSCHRCIHLEMEYELSAEDLKEEGVSEVESECTCVIKENTILRVFRNQAPHRCNVTQSRKITSLQNRSPWDDLMLMLNVLFSMTFLEDFTGLPNIFPSFFCGHRRVSPESLCSMTVRTTDMPSLNLSTSS